MLISLEEEARLALEGARHRFALARQAVADFEAGYPVAVASPEQLDALTREHHVLQIELDSASRHYAKSLSDLNELTGSGAR